MSFLLETPSWLTSWVAWRNYYTEPGEQPFNDLMNELGIGSFLGLSYAYERKYEVCPHCNGLCVINDDTWGQIYCICQILSFQERQFYRYQEIRSESTPASLDDLNFTHEITPIGVRTLKLAKKAAEDFIKKPDFWMLFVGHYGTGKTHILRAIDTAFYPISVYVASRDLEDMVHEYRKADQMQELYSALRYAPILLLDDLGMEYGGKLMGSMVDRIIDARYARWPDFPVVTATNLLPAELPNYVPRAADRLLDYSRVRHLSLQGTSYRTVKTGGQR